VQKMNTARRIGLLGKVLNRRDSLSEKGDIMYICDICKKEITKTNYNGIKLEDGTIVHVCGKHYAQYRKYNKFIDHSPKAIHDTNEFKVDGDIVKVYTSHRNGDISGFFIIDKDDLDRVIVRKWRLWKDRFYTGVKNPTSISQYIIGDSNKKDMVIDHINHNPADNRKSNLRVVPQQKNICNQVLKTTNTSGIQGVYFDISRDKWAVEIKSNYIKCSLGRYLLLEDACYARLVAEQIVFEEFRNNTNDKVLIPLANNCSRKDSIKTYVISRINSVFSFAD